MPSQTWTLTDATRNLHERDFHISSEDLPRAKGDWSVTQRRLQSGLSAGVDLVEIDSGHLRLIVVPTRGMGIWQATLGDETLGWRSPVRGPVHPKFVPLFDPNGLGWLEGFDEFVVRCGLESNGAPDFDEQGRLLYPLHGRIANCPAHHVEVTVDDTARTITLRGIVEETRFHFQKLRLEASVTMSLDSASFTINDKVENFGGTLAEMQMLYHINVGEPLLAAGDRVVAPVRSLEVAGDKGESTEGWDLFGPPVAGKPEQCFFMTLLSDEAGQTQVLLKNAEGTAGTVVAFNTNSLPCFTLWKNEVASADGYVTGLEPATNFPNPRSVESQQGRVVSLAPGETWSAELVVGRLTTASEVSAAEKAIRAFKE
ncbi:MAG: aldose 1-epimerase family protein [Planctomycetes bacterium]|nr:aldose 1-epimerase family protein [Planctomycetota bacterium]